MLTAISRSASRAVVLSPQAPWSASAQVLADGSVVREGRVKTGSGRASQMRHQGRATLAPVVLMHGVLVPLLVFALPRYTQVSIFWNCPHLRFSRRIYVGNYH